MAAGTEGENVRGEWLREKEKEETKDCQGAMLQAMMAFVFFT